MILETSIGVGAGIAGVSSGYWFDSQGYFPPIVVTTALQLVVLFLIFLLPDSLKIREMRNETLHQSSEDRKVSEQIGYGSCEMKTTGMSRKLARYGTAGFRSSMISNVLQTLLLF